MVWKGNLCNTSSLSSAGLFPQLASLYKAGNEISAPVLYFWQQEETYQPVPHPSFTKRVSLLLLCPMGLCRQEALTGTSESELLTWQDTLLRLYSPRQQYLHFFFPLALLPSILFHPFFMVSRYMTFIFDQTCSNTVS